MDEGLRREAERAVQVVTPHGERLGGGRAVLYLLERIGRGRTARALSRRPWIWGVEGTYRLIARNRSFLGRFASREPGLCRAEDASENAGGRPRLPAGGGQSSRYLNQR